MLHALAALVLAADLHVTTQATLPMGGMQLDGTARPPAIGYQVGIAFAHVELNGVPYELSGSGVAFLSLGGALATGGVLTLGRVGGLALGVGAAFDLRDAQGRGLFGGWQWRRNFSLLASCSIALPELHPME